MLSCLVISNFYISLDIFIICLALVEVSSILNILYRFASFIFPGYYFPQKLCRRSLWWLPNQLKPWSVLCLLYTQSVTGVFFQGGFLIAHIITRLQYVKIIDDGLNFYFHFLFFLFFFSFLFLFLEQLRLGVISHAVTSVTTWWCSHKTDHGI